MKRKMCDDFLKIREACNTIGIGRTKLYELLGQGKLKAYKLGSITLISKESIAAFMRDLPEAFAITKDKIKEPLPSKRKYKRALFSESTYSDEELLCRRQIRKFVPASEMTLWRWENEGNFPKHLKINGRNYWLVSEVRKWLQTHKSIRDGELIV